LLIAIVNLNGNYSKLVSELQSLGVTSQVTREESKILKSDKVIIPGSGDAFSAIKRLNLYNLGNVLKITKKPVLGISLGMEILSEHSDEGNVFCLGCIPGIVKKIQGIVSTTPIQYFSELLKLKDSPLLEGIGEGDKFYFRHAYCVPQGNETYAVPTVRKNVSAVIQNENYYGVQFFPEHSDEAGKKVLKNFLFGI
jgi:glutamine amidotransferase